MAGSYKKGITVPSPRANPLGSTPRQKGFPHSTPPRLAPLRTRIYSKAITNQDPSKYTNVGFGDTGLEETPSLLGMSQSSKKSGL